MHERDRQKGVIKRHDIWLDNVILYSIASSQSYQETESTAANIDDKFAFGPVGCQFLVCLTNVLVNSTPNQTGASRHIPQLPAP